MHADLQARSGNQSEAWSTSQQHAPCDYPRYLVASLEPQLKPSHLAIITRRLHNDHICIWNTGWHRLSHIFRQLW